MIRFQPIFLIAFSLFSVVIVTLGLFVLAYFSSIGADSLPLSYVIFGSSLAAAAIVGLSFLASLTWVRNLVNNEILPAMEQLSLPIAQLTQYAYDVHASELKQRNVEIQQDNAHDEVLCKLDGRPCRIYRDGQVDLETLGGTRRFPSIEEARLFIGASGAARIERFI